MGRKILINIMIIICIIGSIFLSGCEFLIDEEVNNAAKEAIKSKDPSKCLEVVDENEHSQESRRENCYRKVAEGLKDESICIENIKDKDKKNYCIWDVAKEAEDESLCAKIEVTDTEDQCYNDLAYIKRNEFICAEIENVDEMADCIINVAKEKEQANICKDEDLYMAPEYRERCISEVAFAKNDKEICFDLESSLTRVQCVLKVSGQTNNSEICSEFKEAGDISLCKEMIGKNEKEDSEEEEEEEYGIIEKEGMLYLNSKPGEVLSIKTEDLPLWAQGKIATLGASINVVGPPDSVIEGDSYVLLDGRPIARLGDGTAHGGKIVEGSDKIFVNGQPVAFIGAQAVDPMISGGGVPHVGGPITNN